MTHDYSQYGDKEPVGDNAMARLTGLAADQKAAETLVEQKMKELENAKAALLKIKEHELPDLMDDLGMTEFKTTEGIKIEVEEHLRGSIPKAHEGEAFAYLENNKHDRLIKREFVISFGMGDEKWAAKFRRDLAQRKKPLNSKVKRVVAPPTLKKFVKEQLEAGVDFPLRLFGVYRQRLSKVTVDGD